VSKFSTDGKILAVFDALERKIADVAKSKGLNGKDGAQGPKGETGKVGPSGPAGKAGKDGRDGRGRQQIYTRGSIT
jgi:hypothetical protein